MAHYQRAAELSDEDQDIDIESDNGAEKKGYHNQLERQRRNHIKTSFIALRDCLPVGNRVAKNKDGSTKKDHENGLTAKQSRTASRSQVLQDAAAYIQQMMKQASSVQKDIEAIRRDKQVIKQQIKIEERKRHYNGEPSSAQGSYNNNNNNNNDVEQLSDSSEEDSYSEPEIEVKVNVHKKKGGYKRSKLNSRK